MAKTLDAADRLLAVDPGNLRALAISVYIEKIAGRRQDQSSGRPADSG